jgi:hypothetical protein
MAEGLFVMGVALGFVHLLCGGLIAWSLLKPGEGPGWKNARRGIQGTFTAGLGLAMTAVIVFLRERPGAITVADQWVMLAGLVIGLFGQGMIIRSVAQGGALQPPAPGERRWPRVYAFVAPLVALILLSILWVMKGMH